MKKITLIFALFAFVTSFGQRNGNQRPVLERSAVAQSIGAANEVRSSSQQASNAATLTTYVQSINGAIESNPQFVRAQNIYQLDKAEPGHVANAANLGQNPVSRANCAIESDCNLNDSTPDDATSPYVWDRAFADGTCCSGLGPVSYDVYGPFTVDVTGAYDVSSVQVGGWDGYLFIYQNCFDPLDQTTNYVAGDDDGAGGVGTSDIVGAALTTGVEYFIVTTGFSAGNFGAYETTIAGPGTVTCGGGGGGASSPCAYENPSNGWENGFNYTGAFGAVENDFTVEAGIIFDFTQITYNTFVAPGETVVSVDVEIKEDDGGAPGAVIASFPAVAPTSQTVIGGNFGFDGSEVVLDMPAVTLEEGTYWVALNNGVSSLGGPLFWEVTSASIVGEPSYQDGAVADPTLDGVYSFSGDCSVAPTLITFDPTANFIGYMNVFETPANGGGFVFGSPWGVPDLKTVIDPTPVDGSATIYPNFNTYDDNPTDPFWVDQGTGLGNKTMEANTYVDDPSLAQQELIWRGYVISNTIDPSYETMAFIKVFNANFSVLKIETAPLVEGEFFEVAYTDVEPDDTFVQYGFYVIGLNASSANEAALGNVVIGAQRPGCGDFTYVNEVPTGSGPPSQIFPDFPDFTSIAVDDVFFTGDAGLICSIDIQGRYSAGAPGLPGDPNGAVHLTIYNDDNGVPGDVRYTETFPGSVDADGDANFTLEPAQVIEATMNPDTRYWISVAVEMEFGLAGQWYWSSAEDMNDNAALWQNPGGGFGVCPTWGTFADCGVGGGLGPDLLMDIEMVATDPLTYDVCVGARTIECNTSVFGDTLSATTDVGVAPDCDTTTGAPGVWYKFEDTSGLAAEILLYTCSDNTDYDTKLSVYTGSCGDFTCVVGNDDDCPNFQSSVEFVSDGNTTFYILVHGWNVSTGNFELTMECTLIPPPNNDIVDAIDLLAVGCPFTDEDVSMPAATEEAGTPSGCDISGAAGVWYEFTPEINGFITGTIASPAGISSVTFYTAPDQSSNESDLVHVDYYQNQCLPGSSATIPVVGGQTYYCFVVNTGGITDIVFDNCQLGTASNEIEGFEFYPNPTRERINLAAAQNIESVVLYNILGQRMIEVNVDATTTELNVAHLAAGAYLMEVTVDGQTGTYKVIKQ